MEINLIKELMDRLWEKYEYASLLASDSVGKGYGVSGRGITAAENSMLCECGYVIKAYDGKSYCEYSFNGLDRETLEAVPEALDRLFKAKERLRGLIDGCEINGYGRIPDEEERASFEREYADEPEKCGDDEIIGRLKSVREAALARDERLLDCDAAVSYQKYTKYFISPNRELSQNMLWMAGWVNVMAKKGEAVKTCFESFSGRGGTAVLDVMDEVAARTVKSTLDLLESGQIAPGEYDCICTPEVTGMIAHEAFGHGVEMDMFVKDRALAREYIGKYVASPLVTMHDGAAAADEVASFAFDDEGMSARDTVVIDKGILKGGINDAQTALALDCGFTGNGRRESFERKAYTRMTNTFFEHGTDRLEDMIASIEHGFLLENATSGMEDPKNWGIQCMVNIAREIKDGRLTGKIYSPVVLSGYVPDLLKSISMMSEKTALCGSGFCGKGYKEWVKVSDGGPYIKARVKLG
ncbi:MAG: TldD/PmbA family protein [Butyrivibrio sp.]|nr:TldD/PmbA family protein [Butyrivibrio sp.]